MASSGVRWPMTRPQLLLGRLTQVGAFCARNQLSSVELISTRALLHRVAASDGTFRHVPRCTIGDAQGTPATRHSPKGMASHGCSKRSTPAAAQCNTRDACSIRGPASARKPSALSCAVTASWSAARFSARGSRSFPTLAVRHERSRSFSSGVRLGSHQQAPDWSWP
eukprot:scaffold646_cov77-Phaeocystis_antarctica.AAC.7